MARPLAAELAEYLSGLRFDVLPPSVVDKAKICVLDAMGEQRIDYRQIESIEGAAAW